MPIICHVPLRRLNRDEFGELSYQILNDVFWIHNELGRFFEERIYKQALAVRRDDVRLEEPIEVTLRSFTKTYRLDVLVARGGLCELKSVDRFVPRHRAQLLHYLLLTDLKHGMLVNVRPEKVQWEYVNSAITRDDRFAFVSDTESWDDQVSGATFVRETVLEMLADWGTCLELSLYEEALTHFLGGEPAVVRRVPVMLGSELIGHQPFRHVSDGVAFKLSAFEDPDAMPRFECHAKRLLKHTKLRALLWINIGRQRITFTTLT
jgi:GxxExxY protein